MTGSASQAGRIRPARVLVLASAWLLACGGAPNAQRPEVPESQRQAWAQRAGTLLIDAAVDPTSEAIGWRGLASAGGAAEPWVRRILDDPRVAQNAATRIEAIAWLTQRGDAAARARLDAWSVQDAHALRWKLTLAEDAPGPTLCAHALQHVSAEVRLAAIRACVSESRLGTTTVRLREMAAVDPAPGVRAAAIETLIAHDAATADLETLGLRDRADNVREATMRALAAHRCDEARERLAALLSGPPSHDGLAAVRALSRCGASTERETTASSASRETLRVALASGDVSLRADAATSSQSIAWVQVPTWMDEALQHDPIPAVRLALALALLPTHRTVATQALHALRSGDNPMAALQAAIALREQGDPADGVLRAALTSSDRILRLAALRALDQPQDAPSLAPALEDPDLQVRLTAATSMLRATAED